eukprot:1263556-Lingulodinium_polyedra.AAC.1
MGHPAGRGRAGHGPGGKRWHPAPRRGAGAPGGARRRAGEHGHGAGWVAPGTHPHPIRPRGHKA